MNRRDIAWGGTIAALVAVGTGVGSKAAMADDTGDVLTAVEDFRRGMVDANGARLLELSHDDMSFGHAGTIVEGKEDTATEKIARLASAGIVVAERIEDIPELVKERI